MRVLLCIQTTGLDYDDRLRKECRSLSDLGMEVDVVALETSNQAARRTVYQDAQATTIRLCSRTFLPRGRGTAIKAAEMYFHVAALARSKSADVVWIHNMEFAGIVPWLGRMRKRKTFGRIVWDQHELPSDAVLKTSLLGGVYVKLVNRCDCIVMANSQRREYVQNRFGEKVCTPIEVLQNYPDALFAGQDREGLPMDVVRWLDAAPYLLAQGGAAPGRCFPELVNATLSVPGLKLIVLGGFDSAQVSSLRSTYGEVFDHRVRFTGMVPQMQIARFIDHARFSIVLYEDATENSRLCAPNRLYQALCRGTPVIVGSNRPMADVVKRGRCGITLPDDGNNEETLRQGIKVAMSQQSKLRAAAKLCSDRFIWDSQHGTIQRILGMEASVLRTPKANVTAPRKAG